MLSNVDCHGTETIEGLEVCVLDEANTSQEGAFQVAARHEQAVRARIVAQQFECCERDDVFSGTHPLAVAHILLS